MRHPRPSFFLASALVGLVPLAQLVVQPGPGEGPVTVRGPAGDAQGGGGLFQRQPGEETEFDQLGTERVLLGQPLEGFVKGGEHVGIFTDACEPSNTVIRKVMAPAFKADGAATVDIAQTDCDPQAQTSQVPNAVLQMKTKNVDRMFMATSFVGVQNFLTNSDAQQFHPKYFASDYDGMAADLFTKNFPPTQWDRTQGISSGYSGWLRAGHGLTPAQKRCSDILVAHGLPAMKDDAANGEVISQCDAFLNIMVPAAKAAGANLTRAGWAQAAQRLGHVDVAGFQACTYTPVKYSCGDSYAAVEWRKEFQGYIQISGYRPANA